MIFYNIDIYKLMVYNKIMEILLDASAIMAVIADEPESEIVINCTKDAIIVSPNMVSFEIVNGLTKMMKKRVIDTKEKMITLIKNFERIPIKTVEADLKKSAEIAWDYKIYAYDAFYLEVAKRLNLPLLTFDGGMRRIGKEIGITVLGGKDAGI
ncbi:twitching motility protein PilT [Spirochaetia bacterium]|nr:twitching motility protein PilT [Spirochaetia bacterium]